MAQNWFVCVHTRHLQWHNMPNEMSGMNWPNLQYDYIIVPHVKTEASHMTYWAPRFVLSTLKLMERIPILWHDTMVPVIRRGDHIGYGPNVDEYYMWHILWYLVKYGGHYGDRPTMAPYRDMSPIVYMEDLRWSPCSMIVYVYVYMWPCFMIYNNIYHSVLDLPKTKHKLNGI